MSIRVLLSLLLALAAGCGGNGNEESTLPDESGDLDITNEPRRRPTGRRVGPDIAGSRWRWTEAHCTEGPLDLGARGFSAKMRIYGRPDGLLLVSDHEYAAERCKQTIVQKVVVGPQDWQMIEEARIAVPPTPECEMRPEENRPGEVVRNGENLEVYVQRSNWCNGLEVRMVYAPAPPAPLTEDESIRHYAAHFNRRDADMIAALFSENGSLVESFTITDTGNPMRHDGRAAVRAWYAEALSTVPWVALRLQSMEANPQGRGQWRASWEYMDPRLENPLIGRSTFTIAAGEIFEAQIEVVEPPGGATSGAK
jgi:hypothetical protein